MNNYETLLIVRQEATSVQVESTTDELVGIISENDGRVARREYWGLLNMAYRIRKNRKGHYILLNYQAPSQTVDDLQYKMRYSDNILRYMTIRTKDLPEEPSIRAQRENNDGDSEEAATDGKPGKDSGYRARRTISKDDAQASNDSPPQTQQNPVAEKDDSAFSDSNAGEPQNSKPKD